MFKYLTQSIDLANNYNYLDRLYTVYPLSTNIRRNIDQNKFMGVKISQSALLSDSSVSIKYTSNRLKAHLD